jgi:hypothetical protein
MVFRVGVAHATYYRIRPDSRVRGAMLARRPEFAT